MKSQGGIEKLEQITLSEQHKRAVELHQKIIISANLAQQNLWDMCTSLKLMRDNKLYKELGYPNFEDYCENEIGMKKTNAYRYIGIVEKVSTENVPSMGQIGMTKLSLLATISQSQQAEIAEKVDLESISVRKLKEEIETLKAEKLAEKESLERKNNDLKRVADEVTENNSKLEKDLFSARKKLSVATADKEWLQKKIDDLESRPIEVAVAETSDNERRLQETIKSLERENIKRNEELERQYREDEQTVRRMLEKEKQDALDDLTEEYESKIKDLQSKSKVKQSDGTEAFQVWKLVAMKALSNIHRIILMNGSNRQMQNIFHREVCEINAKIDGIFAECK